MVFIDCFYYTFVMNYQDLIKFSSSNVSLDSLIRNNNLINYTTQEREREKTSEDDEVKEILKKVENPKSSLTKKQSYSSIQDDLIFLRL